MAGAVGIKLCGLTRIEDIRTANVLLPDYIGFVFAPSRRRVDAGTANVFAAALDNRIKKVGVFVNQPEAEILAYLDQGIIDVVQLHGHESDEMIRRLKARSGKPVIKAIDVKTPLDIAGGQDSEADYLLLDHGKGGTGIAFPWELLQEIGAGHKPFFLAGGINSDNLDEALSYRPFCVDVSSGAETDGKKDPAKMKSLVAAVRAYG